jgi:TatD DNase family protein
VALQLLNYFCTMKFFNLHTHQYTNQPDVLELVNQYPHEFNDSVPKYSIGIHPWYIVKERLEADFEILESKLTDEKCLAIGECGLDKRIPIPMDIQQFVFEKQLALAEKYQKPVIIHCVAAFQELIAITKKRNVSVPMIVHGFSKNEFVAKELLANGLYLSFGKLLLQNPDLEAVFQSVPNDRFFLETDTIAEEIQDVYALAAKYKSLDSKRIEEIVLKNYNTVFNK